MKYNATLYLVLYNMRYDLVHITEMYSPQNAWSGLARSDYTFWGLQLLSRNELIYT